jgi:hypothetical protein
VQIAEGKKNGYQTDKSCNMLRMSFEIQSFGPAPGAGQLPQITDKNVLIDVD